MSDKQKYVMVPREAWDFLCGAGPLDGVWFGNPHPKHLGAFWWRSYICAMLQAAPPAPAPISDTQLDELHGAMSDEQLVALSSLRGGCSCHISPPCNACVEPLTEKEAIWLDLLPEALRGLRNLKVLLGTDSPEVRGWAPAVQQAAQRTINTAIRALATDGVAPADQEQTK